jgi:hypothetical protein
VDANHAPGVAGDAAVGEEVGRVGEDQVNGEFGDGGENFQAVALVDLDVMLAILKRRRWKGFCFQHDERIERSMN